MNNLVLVCGCLKLAIQISRNNKGHWVNACCIFQTKKQKSSVSTRLRCDFCWMVCSNIEYVLLSFPLQLEFPFTHPSWKHYPFNHWVCVPKQWKRETTRFLKMCEIDVQNFFQLFSVSAFLKLSAFCYIPMLLK